MQRSDIVQLVSAVVELLQEKYIFPEVATEISDVLSARLNDRTYLRAADDKEVAEMITADLQSLNGDKHLLVSLIPPNRILDEDAEASRRLILMRAHNFGFEEVRVMTGNIGYMRITAFVDTKFEGAGDAAVAAFSLLSNVDGLIIDLRENGGGETSMIQLTSTYLFESEPIHLNSFCFRNSDSYKQFWTLPYVPGTRLSHVPVFVLCSNATFSGSEEFCYNLQALGRATIVGGVTRGGAHPGDNYPISPTLQVFVPHGRAINPITHSNWEGCGVQPDINCDPAKALDVAISKCRLQLKLDHEVGT